MVNQFGLQEQMRARNLRKKDEAIICGIRNGGPTRCSAQRAQFHFWERSDWNRSQSPLVAVWPLNRSTWIGRPPAESPAFVLIFCVAESQRRLWIP